MALAGVLFFFPVFFPTFKQHEWHGLDLGLCALGVLCAGSLAASVVLWLGIESQWLSSSLSSTERYHALASVDASTGSKRICLYEAIICMLCTDFRFPFVSIALLSGLARLVSIMFDRLYGHFQTDRCPS